MTITDKGRACLLTDLETATVKELALGKTSKEIATSRRCSFKAVEWMRRIIYRKTGYRNEAELCRFAIRLGLIQPILVFLVMAGCAWPGRDKGSKPQPISVPHPATNASAVTEKLLILASGPPTKPPVTITTNITIAWDSNDPPGVDLGYKVYQRGTNMIPYTNYWTAPLTNRLTIPVVSGDYFFAVSARGNFNTESKPSSEVAVSVPFGRKPTGKPPKSESTSP